ncbi:hypothetical protein IAD21_03372 [Abditibacteriota bacterium]|nr:hypothetical protein IAD21_03372 [Abditibacteriota bacterium]
MLTQSGLIAIHLPLVIATSVANYVLWRFIEARFPKVTPATRFCGIIAEVLFVFYGLLASISPLFIAIVLLGSVLGGKLHMLSGGASKKLLDAFHLLNLSSITSAYAGGKIVLRYFPFPKPTMSHELADVLLYVQLAATIGTLFLWWIAQILMSQYNPNPIDETPIAKP